MGLLWAGAVFYAKKTLEEWVVGLNSRTKKMIAAALVIGGMVWLFSFGGLNMITSRFQNIFPPQPITSLTGMVMDKPDPAAVSGATVKIYDLQSGQLLAIGTSDTDGSFTVYGDFESGQQVKIVASAADYYVSAVKIVTLPEPDANSMASVGTIVLGDMCTTTDLTLGLTHDNGTAITADANVTGSSWTGFTVRVTGLADGEALGWEDSVDPNSGDDIVQRPILVITVTGGNLYFATAPDYTIDKGSSVMYVFILDPVQNSAGDATDGILSQRIVFSSTPSSEISDIDFALYVNGDDLDTHIKLSDVMQGAFSAYTAAETIANIDVI